MQKGLGDSNSSVIKYSHYTFFIILAERGLTLNNAQTAEKTGNSA